MAKKSNLLIYGLIGLAGVGAYMYFKKRSSASESKEIETPEASEQEPQKVATVTTAIENVNNGIEKATELLQTVKSGVVEIKDKTGKVRAKVKKKKKVKSKKGKKSPLSQYVKPEFRASYENLQSFLPIPKLQF